MSGRTYKPTRRPPDDGDDIGLRFCPKCGHRWEVRPVWRGWTDWQACLVLAMVLLLGAFCLLKIMGWV